MPGSTVPLGFPYPLAADPLAGPADIQALAEAIDAAVVSTETQADLASQPPCFLVTGGIQSIPNNTPTDVVFDRIVFDSNNLIDLGSEPTDIRMGPEGIYMVVGYASFAPNSTGNRTGELRHNEFTTPATFRVTASPNAAFPTTVNPSTMLITLFSDPSVGLRLTQTSGVTLSITSCSLAGWRIGT